MTERVKCLQVETDIEIEKISSWRFAQRIHGAKQDRKNECRESMKGEALILKEDLGINIKV
jgi:hypothetical protein